MIAISQTITATADGLVSATIPNAPAALNAADYYLDADNATDGADVSYIRP